MSRGEIVSPAGPMRAWIDALLADHAVLRLVWSNFSAVVPGQLYRSNHPTPGRLALLARRHGIRTIVNLRGKSGNGADVLSRAAARRLGLRLIDVRMTSARAPERRVVIELIDAFRAAEPPILVHCKSGADRAGFAAGVFLLLHGATARDASRALSPRFGHFSDSRAGILDTFFQDYADHGEGRIAFEDWARTEYDPSRLRHDGPNNPLARMVNDFVLRRE